jgi:GAF domain-containing protein
LEEDFPDYFQALKCENVLPASHANVHLATAEFSKTYLKQRNICSMLDTPFFLNGELAGVLCLEQVGELRIWKADDIIFAQALSDVVTLAYQASERWAYERTIEELNQSLEKRVEARTNELLKRNKQLEEFAFINAHRFRGPVCSLLGLIQLTGLKDSQLSEKDLLEHLRLISLKLDLITKEITDTLNGEGYYMPSSPVLK